MFLRRSGGLVAALFLSAGLTACSSKTYRDVNYGSDLGHGFVPEAVDAAHDADAAQGSGGATGTGGATGSGGADGSGGGAGGAGGASGGDGSDAPDASSTDADGGDAALALDNG